MPLQSIRHTGNAVRFCAFLFIGLLQAATPALGSQTVLYEKPSPYGTVVITDEGQGLRALRFGRDGARQSLVKPGDPDFLGLAYLPVAISGLALCSEPRRFLIIGLGGGTLPMFLRRYYPDAEIDAVDINPEVAYAAKNHLGFREDSRMRVHLSDGRHFIEQVRQPYDAIFLDAFGADAVPAHLTTSEFLSAVRRAVRTNGVVIGNLWSSATNPPYASMVHTYRATFDELIVLQVAGAGNHILLALPRRQPLTRPELVQMTHRLSAEKGFRSDFSALVEYGVLPPPAAASGTKILTDANVGR